MTTCKILVTGCAGFIGSHLCEKLLSNSQYQVYGIDNLDPYYDIKIKESNLVRLQTFSNFHFYHEDILETSLITQIQPQIVIHLAALAGVRSSLENPKRYAEVNIIGTIHLLEQFRLLPETKERKFILASSSSVYGTNQKIPFMETDALDNINSPYAASKRAAEIYAKMYHQLYQLNITALRFFTVYGPRGRPDMAPAKFMKSIQEGQEITKYGDGSSFRDYTYVEDIVQGIILASENPTPGFHIYNLGNGSPISLNKFIKSCEEVVGKPAVVKQIDNQQGDVPGTFCSREKAERELGYKPKFTIKEGLLNILEK